MSDPLQVDSTTLLPCLVLVHRYPHSDAGRVVAPLFAVAGAVGGVVASLLIHGSPPSVVNAAIWALIGGITAFLVYSSEGPRERPRSLVQAAAADGVVTGITAVGAASILDLILAAGAGTTSGTVITAGAFIQTFLLAAAAGFVGGGLVGLATVPVAGRERLERKALEARQRRRPRKRNRKR